MGDKDPQAFSVTEQQFRELEAKAGKADALEEQNRQMAERIATIEAERRRDRFTNLVTGKGGENDGARWFGEAKAHVDMLDHLAQAFGEDSEPFKAYVRIQSEQAKAIAEQAKTGHLFRELGSSAGALNSPQGRYEAAIRQAMEADPKLTHAAAGDLVLRQQPQLYNELHTPQPRPVDSAGNGY